MIKTLSLLLSTLLLLSSCSGDKPDNTNTDTLSDTTASELNDTLKQQVQRFITSVPVPFEILNKITGSGIAVNTTLLNPESNAPLYSEAETQALNLGVYGADLAYLIAQQKLSESGPYLKRVRQLADNVVIPTAFDDGMMKRLEENKNNGDSLKRLIFHSYKRIDSTLVTNDRLALATLVIAGGWIESLYIATQHINNEAENGKNKAMYDILAEQRKHLENLTALLASFHTDAVCVQLHKDFEALKEVYLADKKFSGEQLPSMSKQIADLRNRIAAVPSH